MEGIRSDMKQHYFVDCSNDEVKDITSAIVELLHTYKKTFNSRSEYFEIDTFEMCGSMAEHTRNWAFDTEENSPRQGRQERKPILEFDFLAILSRDTLRLKRKAMEKCQGHVNIFRPYEDGKYSIFFKANGAFLTTQDVAGRFQSELVCSVAESCHCLNAHHYAGLGYAVRRNRRNVYCRKCRKCRKCLVRRNTGSMTIATDLDFGHPYEKQCNLIFKWRSEAKTLYAKDYESSSGQSILLDRIFILVDLLPAYSFDDTKMELHPEGECRLIPKPCNVCPNLRCWRVSHCISELNLVENCTEMHKQVYMALKIFISISFPKSRYGHLTMPSYILKTAFIQHIDNCLGECFLECVCHILHSLSASFTSKEHRNYFAQYNLLDRYEHLGEEFHSERSSCVQIILHIVRLSELTGSEHCTLDTMRPYLRGTKDIYENLLKKEETLDNYLCNNINLMQKHTNEVLASVRDANPLPKLPGKDQGDHTDSSEEDNDTVAHGNRTSNATWARSISQENESSNHVYKSHYNHETERRSSPFRNRQTRGKRDKYKVKPYYDTSIAARICSVQ